MTELMSISATETEEVFYFAFVTKFYNCHETLG